MYIQFNFLFYSSKLDLISFLKDVKFLVYDYCDEYSTALICFEGNCLIIDSNEKEISELLAQIDASIINVSSCSTELEKTQNDYWAIEEVSKFYE